MLLQLPSSCNQLTRSSMQGCIRKRRRRTKRCKHGGCPRKEANAQAQSSEPLAYAARRLLPLRPPARGVRPTEAAGSSLPAAASAAAPRRARAVPRDLLPSDGSVPSAPSSAMRATAGVRVDWRRREVAASLPAAADFREVRGRLGAVASSSAQAREPAEAVRRGEHGAAQRSNSMNPATSACLTAWSCSWAAYPGCMQAWA